VVAGVVPGYFTNLIAPIAQFLTAGAIPAQPLAAPWSPLLPVAASHNTYSGLMIACGLIATLLVTAIAVRLLANRTTRRSVLWDCGHPEDNPMAQYSAGSFAQPIRRVFATVVFRAREAVVMPTPGEMGPARHKVTLWDPAWDVLYAPAAAAVNYLADHLNGFQYLTIRRYLALVFAALVLLLTVLALWP
jgi:hydrogenase-4 component B